MGMLRNWADGLLSALGGGGRPGGPAGPGYCHIPMSDQEIDWRFQGSWLARKIVTKPATEITREGRDWQAPKEVIEQIEAEEKRLGLKAKLQLAETLRGLGGAGMVLYIAGDADQMSPLDPKRIAAGGLTNVFVWHQSRFTLGPVIDGDWSDPFFGHPSFYEMQGVGTGLTNTTKFHPSRVVAFRGKPSGGMLTSAVAYNRWWWGDSVIEIVAEAVDNVHTGEKGFAKLIRRSAIRRIGVPKLFERVAIADAEANFTKRVAAIAAGENSDDVTWYDAGDGEGKGAETISDVQMTWAGIPDIKASNLMVAAAAACIPATVLLEKAPDGQNATGDGDNRNWEKEVKARQDLEHRPCLDQLDVALIPSALGKVDPTVWWVFAPLSTPTEKEVAETFKLLMEAVTALQATGLLPEEALSRAVQNLLEERGDLPGLSEALALIPEEERFPSRDVANDNPDVTDPSALTQGGAKGGDPRSAGGGGDGSALARRAANDALAELGLDDAMRSRILDALEVGEPADTPFADAYNPNQPRDERGRWKSLGARIEAHADRALTDKTSQETTSLGKVTPRNARLVKDKAGIDLKGYERHLQSGDIRHAMNSHGNPIKEAARGQVALVPADFASIPQIVDTAHTVTAIGKLGTGKGLRLEYVATIAGKEFRYVEQVRPKGQIVALKTMRRDR